MASPACTELEVVMMDWLAKMLGLPQHFLSTAHGGKGGGVIHVSQIAIHMMLVYKIKSK